MDKVALLIAWTLWLECRGELFESKMATASVIWNRADEPKSKYDLSWAILKPKQFSCWNDRSTQNMPLRPDITSQADEQAWADCVTIAQSMVFKSFKPTGSWNHYYAPDKVSPKWADDMKDVEIIGKHKYGRL